MAKANVPITIKWISGIIAAVLLVVIGVGVYRSQIVKKEEEFSTTTFAMDTIITQTAYGKNAVKAMEEVNIAFSAYEKQLSSFDKNSEISAINMAAGAKEVVVSESTAKLLLQAQQLSALSKGAFAVTIEPLTRAWGITTENPRVVPQKELESLLPLVDDSKMQIDGNIVFLPKNGMGIDLGGIAKGAACSIAADIYDKYGIQRAVLSIGGNVYIRGEKPDGNPFKVGFRDPNQREGASIASFTMQNKVIAVSGGYERYFEQDGKKYIHIINPTTGVPAESDIVSVGAIDADGAVADFYSTTLFIWGKEKTLEYMKQGGTVILLDDSNTLYVSAALQDSFKVHEEYQNRYKVIFVQEETNETNAS